MKDTLRNIAFGLAFLAAGILVGWLLKPNPPPSITVRETVVVDSALVQFQARQIDSLRGTTKKAVVLVSQAVAAGKEWRARADALQETVDSMKAGATVVPNFVSTLDTAFAVVEDSGDVRLSGPKDSLRVSHVWPVDVWKNLAWKLAPRSVKTQTIIREIEKIVEVDRYPVGFMGVLVVLSALFGAWAYARVF
jgi:hypothetical protein